MSTTYKPRSNKVAKTPWSYDDGGFDANVDGGQWLGAVHAYLKLPTARRLSPDDLPRVPWQATRVQAKAWARRLTAVLELFRITDGYLVHWRDFLATCGGYDVE